MKRKTALILGLAGAIAATGAEANSDQHTDNGAPVRWHLTVLPFVVDPSVYDPATLPDPAALVGRATTAWQSMPDIPRFDVRAGELGPPGYDPARAENNVSGVAVYHHDFPNRLGRPVLAYTLLTRNATTGEILDADVLMDAEHNVFAELPPMGMLGMATAPNDYQNVLTHELGHVLGLTEDPGSPAATMFPSSRLGEVTKRSLHDPDETSIRTVYAGPVPPSGVYYPNMGGCGGAHVAPVRFGSHGELVLVALCLLGLAASRKRWARTPVVFVGAVLLAVGAPQPRPAVREGVVRSASARFEGGMIVTRAVIEAGGVSSEVSVPGGRVGDIEQQVFHAPSARALRPGARVDPTDYGLR